MLRITRSSSVVQTALPALSSFGRQFSSGASTAQSDTLAKLLKRRPRQVFSGIQPTGNVHIGNYLGALVNWRHMQDMESIRSQLIAHERKKSVASLPTTASAPSSSASSTSAGGAAASLSKVMYSIVNLHAITVPQDPKTLRENTHSLAAVLLACGLDPNQSALFVQSHVSGHSELAWLLSCVTPVSKLYLMTQFKDKSAKAASSLQESPSNDSSSNIPAALTEDVSSLSSTSSAAPPQLPRGVGLGLLTYPVLMAADIMLYRATHIPVGDDQTQHLELSRELARTFNHTFSKNAKRPLFPEPQGMYNKDAARVMNLRTGTTKMSKSDPSDLSRVNVDDSDAQIRKAITRAITDCTTGVTYEPEARPGVANLLEIMAAVANVREARDRAKNALVAAGNGNFSGVTITEDGAVDLVPWTKVTPQSLVETNAHWSSLGALKADVAEALVVELAPIREEAARLLRDRNEIDTILGRGADYARERAQQTLDLAHQEMGLLLPKRSHSSMNPKL